MVERRRWLSEQDFLAGLSLARRDAGRQCRQPVDLDRPSPAGADPARSPPPAASWVGRTLSHRRLRGAVPAVRPHPRRCTRRCSASRRRRSRLSLSMGLKSLRAAVTAPAYGVVFALTFVGVGVLRAGPSFPSSPCSLRSASPGAHLEEGADERVARGSFSACSHRSRCSRIGGGQSILGDLQRQTVSVHHWLGQGQFLDDFAIARASPGPNTLIVTLIGWQVAGLAGAAVASIAIFVPSSILFYGLTHLWRSPGVRPLARRAHARTGADLGRTGAGEHLVRSARWTAAAVSAGSSRAPRVSRCSRAGFIRSSCSSAGRRCFCGPRLRAHELHDSDQRQRAHGGRRGGYPAALGAAGRSRNDGDQVRLRHRSMRGLHGTRQWHSGTLVHAAGRTRRRALDHTIEGIGADPVGRRVQAAWLALDVPQCGYCQGGQILAATALLTQHPRPSEPQIEAAMAGNLCRCGTYLRIRAAIRHAAASTEG